MKNFILGVLFVLIITGVGYLAYQYGKEVNKKTANLSPTPGVSTTPIVISPTSQIVGGDRDEHGCIGSAGYTWCELKKKCLRTWEEPCEGQTANDTELITQALVKKHGWNANDIIVTVSKNDGKYATGGVREKSSEVGGGYFFAAKTSNTWEIVADGNGVILCSSLDKYPDYPNSMIPECYDDKTGKTVKR
jgi:hypothetical protein